MSSSLAHAPVEMWCSYSFSITMWCEKSIRHQPKPIMTELCSLLRHPYYLLAYCACPYTAGFVRVPIECAVHCKQGDLQLQGHQHQTHTNAKCKLYCCRQTVTLTWRSQAACALSKHWEPMQSKLLKPG